MNNILTKYRSFWICLVLTFATAAVFCRVCTYNFVNYDDDEYIYNNPHIQAGITLKAIKWAFTSGYAANWHPVTWLSHMLDWQLFGSNAGGHHIVNLIFHIANTLLLFIILKKMTNVIWPSAFVAALFALHPLHVESVAWVSERKDVLSAFFWLLTMWAYVRFVRRPKIVNYLLVVIFFALGLMSKPMLVTLPFVLLLLDYWPLERFNTKRSLTLLIEKIPLFVMIIVSSIVTFIVQRKGGAVGAPAESYSVFIRLANASISYVQYIIKMIWPVRLAVFYPHPGQSVSVPIAVISAIFLLIVTVLVFRFAGNHKYLVTGWFWYLGTLVPVIGLVQVGSQAMADRYSYIALTGLFIIIAWGAKEFVPKQRYKILTLSAAVVLIALAVTASCQAGYWKDSLTLFEYTLTITKNNYIIRTNYIACLNEAGRFNEAIEQSDELLKIKPDSAQAQSNFGVALLCTGRMQEAVEHLRLAIKYDPNYQPAYFNLGVALQNQGRFEEAVSYYKQSLKIKPDNVASCLNLAVVLNELGRFDEAVNEYRKYLQIKPDDPNVLNTFGVILGRQGKFDEAADYFNRAIQIDPNYTDARDNLNLALAEKQKSREKTKENTEK